MISAIQAGVVEVETSSKESMGSAGSGFADVLEGAVSWKAAQQESEESPGKSAPAPAKTGEKSKSEAPKRRTEREPDSGESTQIIVPTSIAMPVQAICSKHRVADAAQVMTFDYGAVQEVVAEGTDAGGVRATTVWGVEELETAKGLGRVVDRGEHSTRDGSVFSSEKIAEVIAEEPTNPVPGAKGKANEKDPAWSSGEEGVDRPADMLKECGMVAPELRSGEQNLTEPTQTGGQQKLRQEDSAIAKLEKELAAVAEESVEPQDAQSARTVAKPTNKTEMVPEQVAAGSVGAQQVKAQRAKGEKAPMEPGKESLGQSVQIANKTSESKVAASTDDDSLAIKANIEGAAQLETHAADKSRANKENPGVVNSPGSNGFTSTEGPVVSANIAVMDRAKDAGPKASQLTQDPGGSAGSHMLDTSARVPESFVPGGVQLLSRLSHQEMRFGWHSPDFGNIEVRATVDHDRVGAVVSADARLCDSLQADLGSLSRSLANQSLELAHFQTSNSGSGGSAEREQNGGPQREGSASDIGNWRQREIREPVLSIHQGALDLRA